MPVLKKIKSQSMLVAQEHFYNNSSWIATSSLILQMSLIKYQTYKCHQSNNNKNWNLATKHCRSASGYADSKKQNESVYGETRFRGLVMRINWLFFLD